MRPIEDSTRRYMSAEGMVVFVVHAWRYGDTERHSYLVGVYSEPEKALSAAKIEEKYRGGKYTCEVIEFVIDRGREASDEFDRLIIKALPENRRCEPERKEVLIQDKPTWLCGDCSRQWDVSGREEDSDA